MREPQTRAGTHDHPRRRPHPLVLLLDVVTPCEAKDIFGEVLSELDEQSRFIVLERCQGTTPRRIAEILMIPVPRLLVEHQRALRRVERALAERVPPFADALSHKLQ